MWRFYLSVIRDIPGQFRVGLESWLFWTGTVALTVGATFLPEVTPIAEDYPRWLGLVPLVLALLYGAAKANYARFRRLTGDLERWLGLVQASRPNVVLTSCAFESVPVVPLGGRSDDAIGTKIRLRLDCDNRGEHPARDWSGRLVFVDQRLDRAPFAIVPFDMAADLVKGAPANWRSGQLNMEPEHAFDPLFLLCEASYRDAVTGEQFSGNWPAKWNGLNAQQEFSTTFFAVSVGDKQRIEEYLRRQGLTYSWQ